MAVALHRQALARVGTEQKYKRTTDIDPDSRAAAVELHSATGEKPDPRVDQRLLREAAAEYKTALRLDPSYMLARINYGALLLDLGKPEAARKELELATQRAPSSASAWNNLGIVYAVSGDAKKATSAFEKSAKLDDKFADPWFNLGVLRTDAGQGDKAMAAYDEYAKRDGTSGWAKAARARKADVAAKATAKKPSK